MTEKKNEMTAAVRELSAEELVRVTGGGRKWCKHRGRWYVCTGRRAN